MVERSPVADYLVDRAMQIGETLLSPGQEQAAIDEIIGATPEPRAAIETPQVFYLNRSQRQEFAADFTAPTVTRYEKRSAHRLSRYAVLQLSIAARFGTPFGLPDQRDGVVVQDIFPRDDLIDRANSSFGASRDFAFHTDQAYNPNAEEVPDCVMLSCVRNLEQAPTIIAALPEILRELSGADIKQLAGDNFMFHRGRPEENLGVRQGPILEETEQGFGLRLGTDVTGKTAPAGQALSALREAIAAVRQSIMLEAGESLVFPNKTTPHARPAFKAQEDQRERRWLQRIFVKAQAPL